MSHLIIRQLGMQDYLPLWQAMQAFTDQRGEQTQDELWLVEHPPVFTQGLNGKAEHVLDPGPIPIIPVDRGGQVTYHGPGQLVCYLLLDLRRHHLGVRKLVNHMEQAIIQLLSAHGIDAQAHTDAPGVYVKGAKIASLGLRVRRGCSYHGLALNVAMDLSPFHRINPCGYQGMAVTQLQDLGVGLTLDEAGGQLQERLATELGLTCIRATAPPLWLVDSPTFGPQAHD